MKIIKPDVKIISAEPYSGDATPAAIYINPKSVVAIIDEGPIEDEEQEE